jgi:hypothetical protein
VFSTPIKKKGTPPLFPTEKAINRVLVPAGTSKSMLRRHGIQAVTRVIAYVADAVTL